jgi:UDP-N-acetylglucosamine 2-epimerase (non-hydrolysing)
VKTLTVFGTRPEAIKLAPVLQELRKFPEIESRVCVTAQHREMLDQVLRIFEITPDYDLNLMRPNQSLYQLTADALVALEAVMRTERPDVVITQGDTTTTFVASLSAYYAQIPLARVEAGLRTHNKYSPFPRRSIGCLLTISLICTLPPPRAPERTSCARASLRKRSSSRETPSLMRCNGSGRA